MSDAKKLVDTKIAGKKVVVFSKNTCPYCREVLSIINSYNLSAEELEVFELNGHSDMAAIQDYLRKITGARSVPRVFVGGKSVGGCDDTKKEHKNGQLRKRIEAC